MNRAGHPLLAVLVAALAVLVLAACRTTQDTNRELAKGATGLTAAKGVRIARENRSISVTGATVLRDANGVAAVVLLRNRAGAQARVPVGLELRDGGGHSLYRNDLAGLDPSLTSVAAVPARGRTFWVDDQIQVSSAPRRAGAKIGVARSVASALPRMQLTAVAFDHDTDGVFARGIVANRSKVVQRRLVIACISRRGSRIVAAGRAIVDVLPPAPTKKPTKFRVYFIGNPKGGALACTAPPTVLPGGSS